MAKKIFNILKKDFWFQLFSIVSIALIVTGFILPPLGVIDNSVFIAVGELFAFAALWEFRKAVDKGLDAKFQHGNTSITIGDLNVLDPNLTESNEEMS